MAQLGAVTSNRSVGEGAARLAVVIVSYNTEELLRECLASLLKFEDPATTEIVVVDNASVDGSVAMIRREFPAVRLLVQDKNAGFGTANNVGVAACTAPYVMLLNSDAILLEETGSSLLRYMEERPSISCVGPRIVLPSGEPQPRVFGNLPSLWRIAMQSLLLGRLLPQSRILEGIDGLYRPELECEVGWISGVCMMVRRSEFLAVGGFDPGIFMYCEDVELCWKLSDCYGRIVRLDNFQVRHHGGASSPTVASQLRNSLLQQRNLIKIVRSRSGRFASRAAGLLISLGLLLRIVAGLALIPKRGVRNNMLLLSSLLRFQDLLSRLEDCTGVAQDLTNPHK